MIETGQLQTLVAVVNAGTFSKAAEDLNVTQSAISQSIKNLEKKVGVNLFMRSGKKIHLTNEGKQLFDLANKYLMQMSDVLSELQESKNTMSGKLRIGTLTGVGKSWLSRKVIDFSADHPDLNVELKMDFPEELVSQFDSYELDGIIVPEFSLPNSGEKMLIGTEYSTLVFPAKSDFGIHHNISFDELINLPLIMFEYNDTLFLKWCHKIFGKTPLKVKRRLIINSHGNMLEAVSRGIGIAVIPTHVLSRSFYNEKVSTLGEKFTVLNQKFYFVYHNESKELLRMKMFHKSLTESLKTDPLY